MWTCVDGAQTHMHTRCHTWCQHVNWNCSPLSQRSQWQRRKKKLAWCSANTQTGLGSASVMLFPCANSYCLQANDISTIRFQNWVAAQKAWKTNHCSHITPVRWRPALFVQLVKRFSYNSGKLCSMKWGAFPIMRIELRKIKKVRYLLHFWLANSSRGTDVQRGLRIS